MNKSVVVVYQGEKLLGEVVICFNPHLNMREKLKDKIRISYFSTPSERSPPLAVLHTIASPATGVCFKMECSNTNNPNSPLNLMHSSCLRENKTAVVSPGGEELHLVAMHSRGNILHPCFWGFCVAPGLYESCLVMLNLRCLGIVFDLDETLIVANTLRSFEDRIEALQRKISCEVDSQRVTGMLAEVKRYQDDRNILKQYAENDQIVENGKVIKSQSEVVPALSDNHQPLLRPIIRLQEKNIILTRINPLIRDTSVFVRLRPAWEDLRSYLTARGRKRFEVYVCTMAERDYALEMWRLLDPDLNLINIKELLNRVVCVRAGLKKSLFDVFQGGNCHPKMALVIDDRLKVWDEKDQPRVHVVPAFAPYYAPKAEANNAVPILCVARNVACNVRGGFFKDFDDGLLQRIAEISHEDEIKDIISPDVSHYFVSEDDASALNGNREPLVSNGIADVEVERRLKEAMASSTTSSVMSRLDPRLNTTSQKSSAPPSISIVPPTVPRPLVQYPNKQLPQATPVLQPLTQVNIPETSLHNSPAREEGEVPESELDPDTRRRLLILQHGMDMREHVSTEPQFPVGHPMQVSPPQVQPPGGWFPADEEPNPRPLNRVAPPKEFPLYPESMHALHAAPFVRKMETPILSDRVHIESQRLPKEALQRDDRLRLSHELPSYWSFPALNSQTPHQYSTRCAQCLGVVSYLLPSRKGDEGLLGQSSTSNRDMDIEGGRSDGYAESPAEYLHDISVKCGTKVEFRPALVPSTELHFSIEVWFAGEKIGEGIGRTRREAQHQAAEGSLMYLAEKYLSHLKSGTSSDHGDGSRFNAKDNGFFSDANSFGNQPLLREESMPFSSVSEPARLRMEGLRKDSIGALKELCMMEGLCVSFQPQPQFSASMGKNNQVYAQVEIDGEVWGKGIGFTWEEAKMEAAERAFVSLNTWTRQYPPQNRQPSPRSFQEMPSKRFRPDFPRARQHLPSPARYS